MRVVHQKIIVTDNCAAAFSGPPVNLTVLANDIAVTDPEKTLPAFVGKVLGNMPDDCAHMDFVVLADFAIAGEHGVGQDPSAATDLYGAVDHDIRADIGFRMDLGARVD